MSNPWGGHKPKRLRNPKQVTLYHRRTGKSRHVLCFKFDTVTTPKGNPTDYVATAREPGDWYTAAVFPAKHWCLKDEWERRQKAQAIGTGAPKPTDDKPAEPPAATASERSPASDLPAVAVPPTPPVPREPPETASVGLTDDDDEVTEDDIAVLNAPPKRPPTLDEELPGEYNARLHLKDKYGLGKPEDLAMFDAKVQQNVIEQDARRRIEMRRHGAEMQKKLLIEKAGFTSD